ncbi:Hypothetical predicted protein [Xyrichtys novacula]|uniref:Uncharacterized protein n=1 Tax=Xyrichtys novacula TaxID=13765 RepID=A0AAV1EU16_XYRNO|nr:Hypothetical predicted protein [Xyrichtys novacula]
MREREQREQNENEDEFCKVKPGDSVNDKRGKPSKGRLNQNQNRTSFTSRLRDCLHSTGKKGKTWISKLRETRGSLSQQIEKFLWVFVGNLQEVRWDSAQ